MPVGGNSERAAIPHQRDRVFKPSIIKWITLELLLTAAAILGIAFLANSALKPREIEIKPISLQTGQTLATGLSQASGGGLIATAQAKEVSPWDGFSVLKRIAACESTGDANSEPRQFNADGSILWGNDPKTGKPIERDVGILQENTLVWGKTIKAMGLDVIHSESDNITFGKWLYQKYGLSPWNASRNCWDQKVADMK